jgi:hypothetical protein
MSEAKHTPGPWQVDPEPSSDGSLLVWGDTRSPRGGEVVAWCNSELTRNHADARLIAAAPELLAACRAWIAYLDPRDNLYSHEETELIRQMQAAIAKARGG